MGVLRPPPLGILAEGGLRDVDIDREPNETSPVDDGEVPLEQPGPWSAAFPLFSALPEAAFFLQLSGVTRLTCPRLDLLDVVMVSWLLQRRRIAMRS